MHGGSYGHPNRCGCGSGGEHGVGVRDRPERHGLVTATSNEVSVVAVQTGGLVTVLSSSTVSFDAPGVVIVYRVTVTNSGNVTVDGCRCRGWMRSGHDCV